MALLSLKQLTVSFGGPNVLDKVDFQLDRGERICLVGRNGAGKSTLMKVIAGQIKHDDGEIIGNNLNIAYLEQEVSDAASSVFDVVAQGLGDIAPLLINYHHIIHQLAADSSAKVLATLEKAQHELEAADGWSVEQKVEAIISRLSLDADMDFSSLSGGMKRRVLLAQALIREPDILLLDEPTNHLDIASITWLEEFLNSYEGTLLFITHDRMFLQSLATRIIQIDRGQLVSFPGDYTNFLVRRAALLNEEAQQNHLFDKKLAQEEVWIRQGIKARRTRNEGRARALEQLRRERGARREVQGNVTMKLQDAARSGKIVVEVKGLGQSYDGRVLFKDFDTIIQRGDRIGLMGANGCGKTTLLSILLGRTAPEFGSVKLGTKIEVAYFDQLRSQLDEDVSVVDNVGQGKDYVEINGAGKHVMGYLQDFLFTPQRARTPIKSLSGGERNRLLLAKLFTQSANLLVLDEPTNDLDAETLDLLEDLLINYQGTLLLVSHDRSFLNNVVTSTIVFDEDGELREYIGGYDDWLKQHAQDKRAIIPAKDKVKPATKKVSKKSSLTYQEQLDLELLPKEIEQLEIKQAELYNKISAPEFYQQTTEKQTKTQDELTQLTADLKVIYERWDALEAKKVS